MKEMKVKWQCHSYSKWLLSTSCCIMQICWLPQYGLSRQLKNSPELPHIWFTYLLRFYLLGSVSNIGLIVQLTSFLTGHVTDWLAVVFTGYLTGSMIIWLADRLGWFLCVCVCVCVLQLRHWTKMEEWAIASITSNGKPCRGSWATRSGLLNSFTTSLGKMESLQKS